MAEASGLGQRRHPLADITFVGDAMRLAAEKSLQDTPFTRILGSSRVSSRNTGLESLVLQYQNKEIQSVLQSLKLTAGQNSAAIRAISAAANALPDLSIYKIHAEQTKVAMNAQFSAFKTLPLNLIRESIAANLVGVTSQHDLFKGFSSQLASITKPWAFSGFEGVSIAAAMELAVFSIHSTNLPAFSPEREGFNSAELGDFDGAFIEAAKTNIESEAEEIYESFGRNGNLTAFPSESFEGILDATGLDYGVPQPDFIREDGTVVPGAYFDPIDNLLINMLEGHLRVRVITALLAEGGDTALKSFFGKLVGDWRDKQTAAMQKGHERLHLIYYSDFMELVGMIQNKALWDKYFQPLFKDKSHFAFRMQRVHSLRIETSHSRAPSRTERLKLRLEVYEFFQALGLKHAGH